MFFEKQSLGSTALRIGYFVTITIALVVVFMTEKDAVSAEELILTLSLFLSFFIAIYFLVFTIPVLTQITQRGIEVKYRPWIWNWKVFPWHDIKSVTEENVDPIGDFGGWGYRFTFKVEMKSGKLFVITTDRKVEFLRNVAKYLNEEGLNG
jgi:hypothetical protein